MMWLLDTNTCIRYLNPQPSQVKEHLLLHPVHQVVICDIVKSELYFGAHKSQRIEANLALLRQFFGGFRSLPFNDAAAQRCGELRALLAKRGTPIGPYDYQIAAIALVNRVTLVTHNTAEFGRVPGLLLADWETDDLSR